MKKFHYTSINGSGQRVRTTTYPDNGTRVETHYRDGSLERATGTAVFPARYEYGVNSDYGSPDYGWTFAYAMKLTTGGTDSGEWSKSFSDLVGRNVWTLYAGGASNVAFYKDQDHLWKQVDPDGVTTLHTYNAKGEQDYTIVAVNQSTRNIASYSALLSGLAGLQSGTDRLTRRVSSVGPASLQGGISARRILSYAWTNNTATPMCLATNEVSVDGLRSWTITPVGVSQSRTVFAGNGYRYVTNTAPDGSYSVSQYQDGRLIAVTRKDAAHAPLSSVSYGFDAHGRQRTVTDARTGTTTYTHNNADQVVSVTTPAPGTGQSPQTTLTFYNSSLKAWKVTQPDGASVTNEFYPTGLLKKESGARIYPVEYTYDYAGRTNTMTTWQNFTSGAGAAVTTWNYDSQRGWLQSKRYQDGTGPDYTYYLSGRLKERLWARGAPRLKTTYTYNLAGDLQTIDYLDTTPDVTYGYNRLGHQISVVQGGNSVTRVYNLAGNLVSETCTAGTLAGLSVSNRFDHWLRRTNVAVLNGAAQLSASGYAFDAASRLSKVTSGVNSASYRYLANAPLVSQIAFTNNGAWRMTTSKQFDQLNRLQSMASVAPTFTAASFEYTYNNANQRTERREADGVYWRYEYDSLGQVKSGKRYWADGTPVAGQQFEYAFDDIGNRTSTKAGGDQDGANLRSASYSPNLLNQYTFRTVPGAVDAMGVALATNTVTVDGQAPYRKGEYFRKELSVVNTSVPVWKSLTVSAPGETPVTRSEFVPKTPQLFYHDLDGNLVADGRWNYTWDGENRLVAMAARTGVGPQISLKFEYDAQGRRIRKQVWGNAAWSGSATNDLRFVYDGWNLIAVLSPQSAVLRSFTWGLDLSGSLQGAGGVGGLLMVNDTANGVHFPAFDGNGNVAALVKSDGTLSAQYEYGPFAEVLRATGPMAKANPFLFSTKYYDWETGFYNYGYRYYDPSTGRWPNRDPLEERGGINLYHFNFNDPVNRIDTDGQLSINTPAGQQVLWEEMLEIIAADMKMSVQQVIRRVSLCSSIHAAYKALNCKGCRGWGCLTRNEAAKRAACLAQEVGLRATYLRLKCDYFLPGSIGAGSAGKEKSHQLELVNKTAAMVECTAKAAP